MKQGLKRYLEVELLGMDDYWNGIDHIDIAFQQYKGGGARKIVRWSPSDESQCQRENNTLFIPWERSETYLFAAGCPFFVDIRPTLSSGQDLQVDLLPIMMDSTLFKEDDL